MVASAFLPAMIRDNKVHFLFAKEANDDSAPGFSDFGGGVDPGEDIYKAGLREFSEETTGCFGNEHAIKKMVERYGKVLPIVHNTYNIHIFLMDYNPSIVYYFNNTQSFIHNHIKNVELLRSTKIFEKVEMSWMTVEEMIHRRSEFRPFYREIVDKLANEELKRIEVFLRLSILRRTAMRKSRHVRLIKKRNKTKKL
jgi:8-oxo-dGTP pyrophosphatase MutT (NUDIX family)